MYAEVDNLKVWRPESEYSAGYTNDLSAYPSGIYALAKQHKGSVLAMSHYTLALVGFL